MKPAHQEYLFIEAIEEGYFRIDNEGRIWRIATRYGKTKYQKITPRELNSKNQDGYIRIDFSKNGKKYHCLGHRVVWIYFNGEILDGFEINHINGIRACNRPDNLELVNHPENIEHSFKIGLSCHEGEKHSQARLTENDVKEIRLRSSNGEKTINIAKDFNITSRHTEYIIKRKRWKHI